MRGALIIATIVGCWLAPGVAADSLAATRYLSSAGADVGGCKKPGAPCRSMGYAYRQAAPGDEVQLAGGSYDAQRIPAVAARRGPAVVFRPAGGAPVALAELKIEGGFVTVRNMRTGPLDIDNGGNPIPSVKVINGRGSGIWIQAARNLLIKGGSYGGRYNNPMTQISPNPASTNVTFDGVKFHDAIATHPAAHLECMWVGGVQGFTVRNSTFRNCAYFDIFFTRFNGGPNPKDVLLENNVFEVTKQWSGGNAPYTVNVSSWLSVAQNFIFRNNTFGADIAIQPRSVQNMKLIGNIAPLGACASGVRYAHNVSTRARCSATDKRAPNAMSQFVNPAAHDWRLKAGAAAINAADPTDFPARDRKGLRRTGRPDAGAHEYRGIRR